MVIAKRIGVGLAAAVFALALASGTEARTLVFCASGSPEGFDPAPYTLGATFDASAQPLYDRLVAYAPGSTEVGPSLAESWEVSNNGLEYTFHLRPDVTFHATETFTPTRPLNADDVVFSFVRQWKEDDPYFGYAGGIWPTFTGMALPSSLRAVRKVDDRTVAFVLSRPDASLPATLAMDFASIVSKEYADTLLAGGTREALNGQPVGTGPFRLVDYTPGERIRYAANPDYWGGRPAIDELVFDITPDAAVRMAKLRQGACDVIADPAREDLAALPPGSPLAVLSSPGASIAYVAYNTRQPPFDRPEVRRALNMAVDRDAIVSDVYGGEAVPAVAPIPPALWGHDPSIAGPGHNPQAARQTLSAAGVSDVDLTIRVLSGPRSYNPDPLRTAEMIQADLAAVGVDTAIVPYDDPGAFLRETADPEREGAVLLGWTSDNGDPDNVLANLLGCDAVGIANRAAWCDPRFDKLIRDARAETDPQARAALYRQAQALVADAAPWLPIAYANRVAATADGVEGVVLTPFGRFRFDQAAIARN